MIDLRSDTLTLPDKEMLETILTAKLGDDGRLDENGRGMDLTVNELEDLAAEILGKEAALLVPTGTFGNTIGVMTHVKSNEPVVLFEKQHILLTEKFLFMDDFTGLKSYKYSLDEDFAPNIDDIDRLLAESGARLVLLENTLNFTGGYCIPVAIMKKIREVADKHGAKIHMDGARLFHAAAALNVPAKDIVKYVDTVMFCLSKGLGGPIGSLLCGDLEDIKKAKTLRKIFGGGMRQAGIIAAPGIYALKSNVERLSEDIDNAKLLSDLCAGKLKKLKIQDEVQSNLVVFKIVNSDLEPLDVCKIAEDKGLLIRPVLNDSIRLVFYKGITKEDAINAAKIIISLDKEL